MSILVPEVDLDLCTHCRRCAHTCQVGAIAAVGKAVLTFHDLCSGCGACVTRGPN
ncbi:MAG: 4Fe-4S binding protein [Anaerolineales bacterium]